MPEQKTRKTILIVEDDNTLRTLLADRLKAKYEVLEAETGEKGLQITIDRKPDLILLDLLLPNLGGLELLEQVRNHPDPSITNTKVIVLSNLAANENILKAKVLSVSDYLVKANTSLDTIFERIDETINAVDKPA